MKFLDCEEMIFGCNMIDDKVVNIMVVDTEKVHIIASCEYEINDEPAKETLIETPNGNLYLLNEGAAASESYYAKRSPDQALYWIGQMQKKHNMPFPEEFVNKFDLPEA